MKKRTLGLAAGFYLLQLELASEGNSLLSTHIHLTPVNQSTICGPSLCGSPRCTSESFKRGSDPRVTLLVVQAAVACSQSDTNIHCYKSVDFPLFHLHFTLDMGDRFKAFLALQGSRIHFPALVLAP